MHPFLRGALALSPLRPTAWLQGALGIDNRTIRRWLGAEEMPTSGVFLRMVELLEERQSECGSAIAELKRTLELGTLRPANPPKGARQGKLTPRDFEGL